MSEAPLNPKFLAGVKLTGIVSGIVTLVLLGAALSDGSWRGWVTGNSRYEYSLKDDQQDDHMTETDRRVGIAQRNMRKLHREQLYQSSLIMAIYRVTTKHDPPPPPPVPELEEP